MSIAKKDLSALVNIDRVIIHSLESSLYLVSIEVNGQEHYVIDEQGHCLKSTHKLALQSLFKGLIVGTFVMRQSSPYDEMIGQPMRDQANTMEVHLGQPEWV